jgi:hypothetical protein
MQRAKVPQRCMGGAEYAMLISFCGFLLDGPLMHAGGVCKMREWLADGV